MLLVNGCAMSYPVSLPPALDVPEAHEILPTVVLGVFSDKGAFQQPFEAEEQVSLIADGRDDDRGQSQSLSRAGIGQELVAEDGGIPQFRAHVFHGEQERLFPGRPAFRLRRYVRFVSGCRVSHLF